MNSAPIRVVKLGGSLLNRTNLYNEIRAWLEIIPSMQTVWLVGGGDVVESVRKFQNAHGNNEISDFEAHWISVDLLSTTARMFQVLTRDWPISASMPELEPEINPYPNVIFDCAQWMRSDAQLPKSWNTTSDSIAAAVAQQLNSAELYLLKSRCAVGSSIKANIDAGLVDEAFFLPTENCVVSIVNFRSRAFDCQKIDRR